LETQLKQLYRPMPLAGSTHTSLGNDDAPYFTSLTDLDAWMDKPSAKLEGVVPYLRPEDEAPVAQQGRLLVRLPDLRAGTRS
jgi:hypothetical protein